MAGRKKSWHADDWFPGQQDGGLVLFPSSLHTSEAPKAMVRAINSNAANNPCSICSDSFRGFRPSQRRSKAARISSIGHLSGGQCDVATSRCCDTRCHEASVSRDTNFIEAQAAQTARRRDRSGELLRRATGGRTHDCDLVNPGLRWFAAVVAVTVQIASLQRVRISGNPLASRRTVTVVAPRPDSPSSCEASPSSRLVHAGETFHVVRRVGSPRRWGTAGVGNLKYRNTRRSRTGGAKGASPLNRLPPRR